MIMRGIRSCIIHAWRHGSKSQRRTSQSRFGTSQGLYGLLNYGEVYVGHKVDHLRDNTHTCVKPNLETLESF